MFFCSLINRIVCSSWILCWLIWYFDIEIVLFFCQVNPIPFERLYFKMQMFFLMWIQFHPAQQFKSMNAFLFLQYLSINPFNPISNTHIYFSFWQNFFSQPIKISQIWWFFLNFNIYFVWNCFLNSHFPIYDLDCDNFQIFLNFVFLHYAFRECVFGGELMVGMEIWRLNECFANCLWELCDDSDWENNKFYTVKWRQKLPSKINIAQWKMKILRKMF